MRGRAITMRRDRGRKAALDALSQRLRGDHGSGDDCDAERRTGRRRALRGLLRSDAQHRKGVLSRDQKEQVSGKGNFKFKIQNSIAQPLERKWWRAIDMEWATDTEWAT